MSTTKMITIFPEGRAAETVLAVGLDDETTDYLSTYPGTAQWIGRYARETLANDLYETGRDEDEVPGLDSALVNDLRAKAEDLLWPYPRALSLLAGAVSFYLGHVLLVINDVDLGGLLHVMFALAAGLVGKSSVSAAFNERKLKQKARDEECKRIYTKRLRESAPNLINIDDKDGHRIRSAINRVNTIHHHLAQLRRQGLSTVEETAAADDAFNEVAQGHIDERTAKTRSHRYQTILAEVDRETITSDEDLHHLQQLSDDQSQALQKAKDRINDAMNELRTLKAAADKSARHASAKLSAAKLRSEGQTGQ